MSGSGIGRLVGTGLGAIFGPAGMSIGGSLGEGIGGLFGGGGQDNSWMSYVNAQQDRAFQQAAMQHGIRWRVEDAKAAGVHPLFALGAPPFQASSTVVGAADGSVDRTPEAFRSMGQGLERAIAATMTRPEREMSVFDMERQRQELTRGELQNRLLGAQIAKLEASQIGPPGPSGLSSWGGQVNMPGLGQFEPKPAEVTIPRPGNQTLQGGPPSPYVRWFRSGDGLDAEPVKDSKAEDEFGAPLMARWLGRHYLGANMGYRDQAPTVQDMHAAGFSGATGVYFNPKYQKWMPLFHGSPPPWWADAEKGFSRLGTRLDNWTRGRGFTER